MFRFQIKDNPNLVGKEDIKYSTHEEFVKEYKNLPKSMKWKTNDSVKIFLI
jgi:hypothetical protein